MNITIGLKNLDKKFASFRKKILIGFIKEVFIKEIVNKKILKEININSISP